MTEPLYVVHWRLISQPAAGHVVEGRGCPISRTAAQSYADFCNRAYPEVHHWIMPVTLSEEPVGQQEATV